MGEIAQIEPSYDDLAFEPEMTWEELVEKAKELGYEYNKKFEHLTNNNYYFYKDDGKIYNGYLEFFASDRTPAQMYQIMKALEN